MRLGASRPLCSSQVGAPAGSVVGKSELKRELSRTVTKGSFGFCVGGVGTMSVPPPSLLQGGSELFGLLGSGPSMLDSAPLKLAFAIVGWEMLLQVSVLLKRRGMQFSIPSDSSSGSPASKNGGCFWMCFGVPVPAQWLGRLRMSLLAAQD